MDANAIFRLRLFTEEATASEVRALTRELMSDETFLNLLEQLFLRREKLGTLAVMPEATWEAAARAVRAPEAAGTRLCTSFDRVLHCRESHAVCAPAQMRR